MELLEEKKEQGIESTRLQQEVDRLKSLENDLGRANNFYNNLVSSGVIDS